MKRLKNIENNILFKCKAFSATFVLITFPLASARHKMEYNDLWKYKDEKVKRIYWRVHSSFILFRVRQQNEQIIISSLCSKKHRQYSLINY